MSDFLSALWRTDYERVGLTYGELRTIRDGKVGQRFYDTSRPNDLMEDAHKTDLEGTDCYMGVLPRTEHSGTAADCLPETSVLWADVDGKAFDGSKAAALFGLGRSQLTPSILVDSGNGWHAYWLLREPHPFSVVQPLMRGLQRAIGSDAVHDAPRVLRLPGTRNHKQCDHASARCTGKLVRLLHFDPLRQYRLGDFDDYTPEEVYSAKPSRLLSERVDWLDLPTWLTDLIEQGAPAGQRSEAIFRAVMWLHRYGWDEARIRHVLDREPIGQKMHEMRPEAAERWFNRTFDHAVKEPA